MNLLHPQLKMKILILFVILLLIWSSCQFGDHRGTEINDITIISLFERHPKKEVHIRDIADIEYIALETTDDVLLGQLTAISHVSDKYIVLWDLHGNVFIFDRTGRIISHFNHSGQGPREFLRMAGAGVVFDEKNREVFIFDAFSSRILVYSIAGEYRRTLHLDADLTVRSHSSAFSFDNETLLIYDNIVRGRYIYSHNERPFILLSKKDGSIVSDLDVNLPVRYHTSVTVEVSDGVRSPLTIDPLNNRRFGTDFVIANISSDTIYKFTQNRELTPWLVRRPSVHSSEPRRVWTPLLTTDRFMIFQITTLDFIAAERGRGGAPGFTLMYEFETGQISNVSFVNDDFPTRAWQIYAFALYTSRNTTASLLSASRLRMSYEENLLKGELKELAATIDEEDNPVLMIVKFR